MMPSSHWLQLSYVCGSYDKVFLLGTLKFRVGDLLLIPPGFGGIVNHSKHPNMEKVIAGQIVYLRTTRAIHPGEELFFTYREEFFKEGKREASSCVGRQLWRDFRPH